MNSRLDLRKVPEADIRLFDHLVSAAEQWQRDRDAERPRGLEVDDQLDLRRLLDRQIGWLFAFKNATGINPDLSVGVGDTAAVARSGRRPPRTCDIGRLWGARNEARVPRAGSFGY